MCPARLTAIASTAPSTRTGRPQPAVIRSACRGGAEQVLALAVQGGGRRVHPLRPGGLGVGQPACREPHHSPTTGPAVLDERDDDPVPQRVDQAAATARDGDAGVDQLPIGEPSPAQMLHEGRGTAAGRRVPKLPTAPGHRVHGQVRQSPIGQGRHGQRRPIDDQPLPVPAGRLGQSGAQPSDVG